MELRQLEYFVAVAEERHFTRAAARVHVSQSGLSATIKSLESELHAPLFERTTRRVRLTAAGAALLPDARRALGAARAGEAAVGAIQGLRRGSVSIGVMQQMGIVGLPRILVDYQSKYPGIDLRLRHAGSGELHRLLAAGEVDFAVATAPEPADDRLLSVELLRTPLVLVCRPDDDLAGSQTVKLKDLAERTLIGFAPGWGMRTATDRLIRGAQQELDLKLEVNDTPTLLDLVEAGLGVALIAQALAAPRRRLTTVPMSGRQAYWTVNALSLAPGPTNPAARELWRLLTRER